MKGSGAISIMRINKFQNPYSYNGSYKHSGS